MKARVGTWSVVAALYMLMATLICTLIASKVIMFAYGNTPMILAGVLLCMSGICSAVTAAGLLTRRLSSQFYYWAFAISWGVGSLVMDSVVVTCVTEYERTVSLIVGIILPTGIGAILVWKAYRHARMA